MGYWLKSYVDILDDPKVHRMSERAQLAMHDIFHVAKKLEVNDQRTGLVPEIDDIAFYSRRAIEFWEESMPELINAGIVEKVDGGYLIVNYVKRQEAIPDDERKRQSRKKINDERMSGDGNVLNSARNGHEAVTIRDGEKIRVDKSREELRDREDVDVHNDIITGDIYNKSPEELAEESANQPFAVLSRAFVEYSGLPELAGGPQRYTESISKMINMGVTPEILGEAITDLRDKNYNIISPGSCLNACMIVMGRKNGKRAGPSEDHRKYLSGEYGDVGWHNDENQEVEA